MFGDRSTWRCVFATIVCYRLVSSTGVLEREMRVASNNVIGCACVWVFAVATACHADDPQASVFFERRIRPLLVKHCYECHSEAAKEQQGGLLLDRHSGWMRGGDTRVAVVPGEPDESLLIQAVRYTNDDLQMPPDGKLTAAEIRALETWVKRGAEGPKDDLGDTEFSRLGDQGYLFQQAKDHWAFQPVKSVEPPTASDAAWNHNPIDQFVFAKLEDNGLTPSRHPTRNTLNRRLHYSLLGLPPAKNVDPLPGPIDDAMARTVSELLQSPAFGEHVGRMWLDVARYADTDSAYRPDTRTPHYFPFAFTYRDYVIDSLNSDKPFDQFVKEQLAADLMGFKKDSAELAGLGFMAVGPYANRSPTEALDDWIDTTTRGLMGMSVACARCHDHKYEPIPTADYYSLRGIFASIDRIDGLNEKRLPQIEGYSIDGDCQSDYQIKRQAIDKKIAAAKGQKSKNNNRSISQKIRETELAQLLLFHPGAPVHAMVVRDKKKLPQSFVFLRGEPSQRGDKVPRRFLKVIDPEQPAFPDNTSGRLQLAENIVAADNPLTARVFVNRVWGMLMGSYLVDTPSDFGLQGSPPTHPELLDWLAADFIEHGWSVKHLVRRIVTSQTWRQSSRHRDDMAAIDPENKLLWRANRQRLSIEELRDSALSVAGQLDRTPRGRAGRIWGDDYTRRRTIYGFINRFNLDPTLRAFDFPTPMQTQAKRTESIVPSQALFTLNSPFVVDQAKAITQTREFTVCQTTEERIAMIYWAVFQRSPVASEVGRIVKVVEQIERMNQGLKTRVLVTQPWPVVAQSLLMSNEFQYID